jgi:hypothetical protein
MTDTAWNGNVVLSDGGGEQASLALDPQGRPRMAFRTSSGELGYEWCDEACESPEGAWGATYVEGQMELVEARQTALPFTCDGELWNGQGPQLTLLPDGAPLVTYDLSVQGRCLYEDRDEPDVTYYNFHEIWHGARMLVFRP